MGKKNKMDIETIILAVPVVIGSATLIFRALQPIASWTRTQKDDRFLAKGLRVMETITKFFALNKKEVINVPSTNKLTIKVSK